MKKMSEIFRNSDIDREKKMFCSEGGQLYQMLQKSWAKRSSRCCVNLNIRHKLPGVKMPSKISRL